MTASKLDMSRAIPAGYSEIVRIPELGVLVVRADDERTTKAFSGRSVKPDFFLRFESKQASDGYVSKWISGLRDYQEKRRLEREARKVVVNPFSVGQVLVATYGYEQTNVNFYQVVATPGKATVEIREIQGVKATADVGMMGTCLPVPGAFVGEAKRKRVSSRGEVKIDTCSTAEALSFTVEEGVKIYKKSYWSSYA